MEILTDLVKRMSISGDLDTGAFVADKVSDWFGTVESLRQIIKHLLKADQVSLGQNQKVTST